MTDHLSEGTRWAIVMAFAIATNIANYVIAESNADYRRKISVKTKAAMKDKAARG